MAEEITEPTETTLSDEDLLERIEDASEGVGVSPLHPDFLIILGFAVIVDLFDMIIEWFSILILPKLVLTIIDIVTFLIIGGWIYWRTGKIIQSRKDFVESLAKKSPKMAQQLGKMERTLGRIIKSPLSRTLIRAGGALLGELIPYIGLIPFWIISVILTLREK